MDDGLIPLHDILKEIEFLKTVRTRTSFDSFKCNPGDLRAVSFSVLVISEAARRIPDVWLAAHPDIPWHAIRTIGNKLRHEYQRISETILWGIVERHADEVKAAIEAMLAKHS